MQRLAIISSHPIQYYAPWFRYLTQYTNLSIRVFYLWDFGVTSQPDREFNQAIQWDIPLLEGYESEFVPNCSARPGTGHFWGLQNPTLAKQVGQFQPDAVLMMNYNYASLYRFLWEWQQTPLLFRGDSHRLLPEQGIKARLKQQWIRQIYQRFQAVLYVGQANYGYFRDHGVAPERLFFSPHAIENQRFVSEVGSAHDEARIWKRQLGIPEEYQVVLFAGKFIPKKRPLDLIQAFIQADLAQTALIMVGSGELEAEVNSQAACHPHIYVAPFQNQSQMPRTYAAADVVVLPSYGSSETWGLAINEAMCLGKPVIVSSHVGCAADLVQPGKTGWCFPAGDISALARILGEALGDTHHDSPGNHTRLPAMGQAAQRHIAAYSYAHATEGLVNALSVLSAPPELRVGQPTLSRYQRAAYPHDAHSQSPAAVGLPKLELTRMP